MKNPHYGCTVVAKDYLDLIPDYSVNGKPLVVFEMPTDTAYLSKDQVKDVIAQLQSWIDTGEWIKPKKKYCCVPKDKSWAFSIVEDPSVWRNKEDYERELYT
jgi:hypothetical protein